MLCDPLNTSLLDGMDEQAKTNIALLLNHLDARLMHQIELLRSQIGGKLSAQAAGSKNRETRLQKLENCPCAVHRDPVHTCVVLDMHDKLARIEAKIETKLMPLKLRLAYIMGAVAIVAFLMDLVARMVPAFWR
jgi:hypothetical protein